MNKKNFRRLTMAFLMLTGPFLYAQTSEKTTSWKGFEKVEFTFENRNAWYVKPHKAIAGNPWIWRAHFPTWHTDMDSILVSRGFHVAHINTNDMFAHPKAMQVWDAFYDYLVKEKQFAPKVALEGVSRGGLYVYGWAKRNPDKVAAFMPKHRYVTPKAGQVAKVRDWVPRKIGKSG